MLDFLLFIVALVAIIKSADLAMRYSSLIAKDLKISKHLVGFLIVALISVLPEAFIAVMSAFQGEPSLGLGTLFGSNIADLTLVFALIIFFSKRDIKISSKIIKSSHLYLLTMSVPLLLGCDGHFSRFEGILLVVLGAVFYVWMLKKDKAIYQEITYSFKIKNLIYLLLSMALLLVASYMTVKHGIALAQGLGLSPIIIGILGVSIGTTLPELFFSIKAVRKKHYDLALGDILGTVITDAVIIVGIMALIHPFTFPVRSIYITGLFMLVATAILFHYMKTNRVLNRKEGILLALLYLVFIVTELNF
jgi:cation:H+ antiporter